MNQSKKKNLEPKKITYDDLLPEAFVRQKVYPLGDLLTREEAESLCPGGHFDRFYSVVNGHCGSCLPNVMAVATGEMRPPRKGEWYLTGSIVTAYRASNDYLPESIYKIARLVFVKVRLVLELDE